MKKSKLIAFFALLSMLLLPVLATSVEAASVDKSTSGCKVRVRYNSSLSSVCDVVLIGVGTSMSITSYDNLASKIDDYGYVVVIMDHNPGNMVKTDATKYRNGVLWVKNNLLNWLSGTGCSEIGLWVLGGHSAGGEAAQAAVSGDANLGDAVFSIDPYNANSAGNVSVPAMYWGFDFTTCFVNKNDAAKAAYYNSMSLRAFYRVKKVNIWTWCGYSPKYFHCSFCDNHCPGCTNCKYTPTHFYEDVAESVDKFISALVSGNWSKQNLQISATTPLTLFVDSDTP